MHPEFDLIATDGTRLNAWRNRTGTGTPVIICNGMGVPRQAWPLLMADDCPYPVAGWHQRGCFGSDRPADESRITVKDHVGDATALMDHLGWDRAILVGWSLGVNVAFEMTKEHPDRVSGILAIAGVPGGTLHSILGPQFVPRRLRRPVGMSLIKTAKQFAPVWNGFFHNLPGGRPLAEVLRMTGLVLPHARSEHVAEWATVMKSQDFNWYFRLAEGLADHDSFDASFVRCPVTFVAGSIDIFTSGPDVLAAAGTIAHAETRRLPGSHALPIEFPDKLSEFLADLADRVEWQDELATARSEAGIRDDELAGVPPEVDLTEAAPDPDFVA